MTNKTLFSIIAAIIVVCAGAAGYFYWMQTKPLVVTEDQIKQAQEEKENNPNQPPMSQNECVRNFDENKLKTETVAIAGRQVEIDVKDFGKMVVEFYDKDAPKTVENFLRLTNSGYYNCLTFHRIAQNFVIQGGDPTGTGSGGQSAFGGTFEDELNANTASYKTGYKKGVLAMANRGEDTNTSQFFIMLADNETLPKNYTIFGKVISGLEVVDKIGQVEIEPGPFGPTDGSPKTPVVMQSVKIIK